MNKIQHPLIRALLSGAFFSAALVSVSSAAALKEAEVHKIINDVRVVNSDQGTARPAILRDVIKGNLAVRTGAQSRAELLFQDQTLTRLGADSLFAFTPTTREMKLDRGTMLLQVPKGLGGATIRTAAVTAAITGTTIMLESKPGSHVKVLVLEGSLKLSLGRRGGGAVTLTPGKMIVMAAADKKIPQPVNVDLKEVVKTSALVDPAKFRGKSKTKVAPLPSLGLIEREIDRQDALKKSGRLVETNLVIKGDGSNVVAAPNKAVAATTGNERSATQALDNQARANSPASKKENAKANGAVIVMNSDSLRDVISKSDKDAARSNGNGNSSANGNGNSNGNGDNSENVKANGNGNNKGNGNGKGNGNNSGKGNANGVRSEVSSVVEGTIKAGKGKRG